jgi:hypothetical protein
VVTSNSFVNSIESGESTKLIKQSRLFTIVKERLVIGLKYKSVMIVN